MTEIFKQRFDILITDARNDSIDSKIERIMPSSKKNRENLTLELKKNINQCKQNNSNFLISVYPSERLLEVMLVLHDIFQNNE